MLAPLLRTSSHAMHIRRLHLVYIGLGTDLQALLDICSAPCMASQLQFLSLVGFRQEPAATARLAAFPAVLAKMSALRVIRLQGYIISTFVPLLPSLPALDEVQLVLAQSGYVAQHAGSIRALHDARQAQALPRPLRVTWICGLKERNDPADSLRRVRALLQQGQVDAFSDAIVQSLGEGPMLLPPRPPL
jgi:hypothetical protein